MSTHRLAVVCAFATFLLLMVGGTVNPTGSSLACPEAWFICHGTLFPQMTGGVLFEHGHRMVAMTVGLLQIALSVALWRRRPDLARWGWLALALVCVQGSLGAATVHYKLPWFVSTAHLMTAFGYFALVLFLAVRTRPATDPPAAAEALDRLRPAIGVAAAAVYLQVTLGALVRHSGGALASLDLPLHHGSLWPAGAPIALKLHMLHRIVGVLVGGLALGVGVAAARTLRGRLRLAGGLAAVLVVVQIALGALVIWTMRSVPVVVAHVGVAAAVWAMFVLLWFGTRPVAVADAPRVALTGREVAA
ncbi:MAG: hypothetical protein D6689_00495 [Deltaproteobacteria bacterium]|nr:MAG: hypothetical protein D6689_00495 [Deltaproteobacteria bacterium]